MYVDSKEELQQIGTGRRSAARRGVAQHRMLRDCMTQGGAAQHALARSGDALACIPTETLLSENVSCRALTD